MPVIPVISITLFMAFLVNMPNKNVILYFFALLSISAIYYLVTDKKED
jgi:hypothetical protein